MVVMRDPGWKERKRELRAKPCEAIDGSEGRLLNDRG